MKRVVMLSALVLLASACGSVTGAVDDLVDQSVFALEVGLCFDDDADAADEISSVPDRECQEPHDNEVYAVLELDDGDFPGQEALSTHARELCTGATFEDYVGIPYLDSELEVFPLTPTESGWEGGDHEVVCALFALDQSKLEGSMKDSRR